MKNLLILSYSEDPHALALLSELDSVGAKHFWLYTNEIPSKHEILLNSSSLEYTLMNNETKEKITLDPSWNIWNRRILKVDLPDTVPEGLAEIVNEETKRTLEGIMFSHNGKVVNDPRSNYRARNKLDQLKVAKNISLGVIIPATIVTNNPEEITSFYKRHNGKICFKLQKGAIVDLKGEKYTVMTNLVEEKHLENIESLRQCPHLFQEYIDKDYEVRATVVGNAVMGTAIHSQDSEISKIDYRRYDFNVKYEKIDLPKNVEEFCLSMNKHYGLDFGAFDFIISKKGEYVFLELNPNGQWLWLEQLGGPKISKTLAEYLVS